MLAIVSGIVSFGVPLAVGSGADARTFRVYTCTIVDDEPLGPAIESPASGWELGWSGLTGARSTTNARPAIRSSSAAWGRPWPPGRVVWVRWTAAPDTRLVGLSAVWEADSIRSAGRGQGTGQFVVETDTQTLLTQNSAFSVWFGVAGAPRFAPSIEPARIFQLRFTCLDRCETGPVETFWAAVFDARFDVDDSSAPVGGVRSRDGCADGLGQCASVSTPRTPAAVCIGRWSRSMALMPCRSRSAIRAAVRGARARSESQRVRRRRSRARCGSTMGRWTSTLEAAAGSPQRAGAARGRRRESDGGVRARDAEHHGERGDRARVGPGVAGRRERGGGERLGEADRALGAAGEPDAARQPVRAQSCRPWAVADDGGAPIANAALDVVSKTTAVNARELAKRTGPRTGTDGRWFVVLPRGVSSRD